MPRPKKSKNTDKSFLDKLLTPEEVLAEVKENEDKLVKADTQIELPPEGIGMLDEDSQKEGFAQLRGSLRAVLQGMNPDYESLKFTDYTGVDHIITRNRKTGEYFYNTSASYSKNVENMMENAEGRVRKLKMKNEQKVQSGIYLDPDLEALVDEYVDRINLEIKEYYSSKLNKPAKIIKSDFVDNIIYNYLYSKNMTDLEPEDIEQDYDLWLRLESENKKLLKKVYANDIRSAIYSPKSNRKNLYMRVSIYNDLLAISNSLYSGTEGGKKTFTNLILKNWFITKKIVPDDYFRETDKDRYIRIVQGINENEQEKAGEYLDTLDQYEFAYGFAPKIAEDNYKLIQTKG